jgi:hypothetical protein
MLLSGVSTIYFAIHRFAGPRLRNAVIFGALCAGCAVLLYFKPRFARWPVAMFYLVAMLYGANEVFKINMTTLSPPAWIVAYWWGDMFLSLLLFYALVGSNNMNVYINAEKAPNQSSDPILASGTSRARHEPRHR